MWVKTEIDKNQKFYIVFDGVYNNAEFWLNGIRIGNHPFGYAPIYYDLTDLMAPKGEENRISVRVDHSRYADSRWYTGSGIYRNVHVLISDKLHIPVWGTFITTPEVSKESAIVEIQVEVKNDNAEKKSGTIVSDIFDNQGVKVASFSLPFSIDANNNSVFTQNVEILNPELWGIDAPNLYTATTKIEADNKVLDERNTRFGIR